MKKITILLLFLSLILIAGCNQKEYTFAEGFQKVVELDAKYNGSFKEEGINYTVVPLENIDEYLKEIGEFEKDIRAGKDTRDKEALLLFINVRKNMLSAEKNYQLALQIGDIGLVTDEKGFTCGEARYILDVAYYYNETFTDARAAEFGLDDLLYAYADIDQLLALVGVDDEKTRFYLSPLDDIDKTMRTNRAELEKNCKIKVVTK